MALTNAVFMSYERPSGPRPKCQSYSVHSLPRGGWATYVTGDFRWHGESVFQTHRRIDLAQQVANRPAAVAPIGIVPWSGRWVRGWASRSRSGCESTHSQNSSHWSRSLEILRFNSRVYCTEYSCGRRWGVRSGAGLPSQKCRRSGAWDYRFRWNSCPNASDSASMVISHKPVGRVVVLLIPVVDVGQQRLRLPGLPVLQRKWGCVR